VTREELQDEIATAMLEAYVAIYIRDFGVSPTVEHRERVLAAYNSMLRPYGTGWADAILAATSGIPQAQVKDAIRQWAEKQLGTIIGALRPS
jgi:hypothetical protein